MSMKKTTLFLSFILLSLFFISTVNAATPVASIVLSDPFVSNNLTHYTVTDPENEPYTVKTTKGGLQCIHIPSNKYGYFNANDATIPSNQNNLIFYITYFDEGTGNLNLQYNANDATNYKAMSIKKTGTNTWITATVAITNASFRNAQNNACDFRIDANNYIREISIAIGTLNPATEPLVNVSASAYSEFIGKTVAGYQAWFSTGDANTGWFHWNGTTPPSPGKLSFEVYPDVSEYEESDLAQTALANLGNGSPSKLFNSANTNVINKHFNWMKDAGIDGAAVQRFINGIGTVINNSQQATPIKIKQAAEANNRIFYICYDISSSGLDDTWDDIIKFDWVYNIEQAYNLTSSPAYAKVGNKPVVQLWGTGFTGNHPGTEAETIALINFLKSRGCYVIGGVPTWWRTQTGDSKPNFLNAYLAYDMISPWFIGRFSDNNGANNFYNNPMVGDKALCDQNGIKYMPTLFPGFAWSQWNQGNPNAAPRNAGEFMWHQAKNIKNLGVSNMYFAMFDEYDEGTAIMKAATDWSMIPTNQYFLTTSADGTWCSSDFQLRVAGAAIEMLKGTRAATTNVPIPYSLGPVYYRNSFEKRTTPYNYVEGVAKNTGTFNLDPCFLNPASQASSNVSSPVCEIQQTNVKSGLYSVKASGTISSAVSAIHYYKIADVKIAVKQDMKLSFWKKTENDFGRFVFVDFITKNGKNLRDNGYVDQNNASMHAGNGHGTTGAGWEQFTCNFGNGILLGDTITGIVIAYDHAGAGSYTAYFDDFLIEDGEGFGVNVFENNTNKIQVIVKNGSIQVIGDNIDNDATLAIYNTLGNKLSEYNNLNRNIQPNMNKGIYIVKIKTQTKTYTQKIWFE